MICWKDGEGVDTVAQHSRRVRVGCLGSGEHHPCPAIAHHPHLSSRSSSPCSPRRSRGAGSSRRAQRGMQPRPPRSLNQQSRPMTPATPPMGLPRRRTAPLSLPACPALPRIRWARVIGRRSPRPFPPPPRIRLRRQISPRRRIPRHHPRRRPHLPHRLSRNRPSLRISPRRRSASPRRPCRPRGGRGRSSPPRVAPRPPGLRSAPTSTGSSRSHGPPPALAGPRGAAPRRGAPCA